MVERRALPVLFNSQIPNLEISPEFLIKGGGVQLCLWVYNFQSIMLYSAVLPIDKKEGTDAV
jgi:hypothetical protein